LTALSELTALNGSPEIFSREVVDIALFYAANNAAFIKVVKWVMHRLNIASYVADA